MAKQIVAKVPDALHQAVKLKAVQVGKSITQIINELLEQWVSDEPPEEEKDVHQTGHGLG